MKRTTKRASLAVATLVGFVLLAGSSYGRADKDPAILPPKGEVIVTEFQVRLWDAYILIWKEDSTPETIRSAAQRLEAAFADPEFTSLSSVDKGNAYSAAGWAALRAADWPSARDHYQRAVDADPTELEYRRMLSRLQWNLGERDAALANLLAVAASDMPLPPGNSAFVWDVVRFTDAASADRSALLETLFENGWKPEASVASHLWYQLALARLKSGTTGNVGAVLKHIKAPDVLVMVRADKRFDPAYDRALPEFDVETAARAYVQELRRWTRTPPVAENETADLTRAMLLVGDHEQALALATSALSNVTEDTLPKDVARLMQHRAIALLQLGRVDEAVAIQEAAAALPINGKVNVNQTLDLAAFYCDLGRDEDALRAADSVVEDLNPFGSFVKAYQRHCAAVGLGDAAMAEEALRFLEANKAQRPSLYVDALVREGRLDAAATAFIALLGDESLRGDTLASVQDYAETPNRSKQHAAKSEGWRSLLAREDVKAAIDRVGRIEHYDIYP